MFLLSYLGKNCINVFGLIIFASVKTEHLNQRYRTPKQNIQPCLMLKTQKEYIIATDKRNGNMGN